MILIANHTRSPCEMYDSCAPDYLDGELEEQAEIDAAEMAGDETEEG